MLKAKFVLLISPIFLISGLAWSSHYYTNTNQTLTTAQYISDDAITAKVKFELLANKDIKKLPITVTTSKGIVTLNGNVENTEQKQKIIEITSYIAGVRLIDDKLFEPTKE